MRGAAVVPATYAHGRAFGPGYALGYALASVPGHALGHGHGRRAVPGRHAR
ncbi:hypothetical protein SAMN05216251_101515 [Actinacidiphila alni]|uniref:Uncharacterized protein n=1 Tax=Actinacidiphila alni TaxID=380248 RepID=A0A1I1XSM1_9ACTN|nr:hypothetical protein SAMN05216251_101515 [Actinacidiphila alni]